MNFWLNNYLYNIKMKYEEKIDCFQWIWHHTSSWSNLYTFLFSSSLFFDSIQFIKRLKMSNNTIILYLRVFFLRFTWIAVCCYYYYSFGTTKLNTLNAHRFHPREISTMFNQYSKRDSSSIVINKIIRSRTEVLYVFLSSPVN